MSSHLHHLELSSTRSRALVRMVSSFSASSRAVLYICSSTAPHGLDLSCTWLRDLLVCSTWSSALLRMVSSSSPHGLELWPTWSRAFPLLAWSRSLLRMVSKTLLHQMSSSAPPPHGLELSTTWSRALLLHYIGSGGSKREVVAAPCHSAGCDREGFAALQPELVVDVFNGDAWF